MLNLLDLSTPDELTDAYLNYSQERDKRLLNSVLHSVKLNSMNFQYLAILEIHDIRN